jgi:hypothetical protein
LCHIFLCFIIEGVLHTWRLVLLSTRGSVTI